VTGRIHPHFVLGGTITGRLSCQNPNIQQAPREKAFRSLFKPQLDDYVYVVADYSQIELRIASLLAGEDTMLAAYENGDDLHALTASAVTGVPIGQITKEQRTMAKAVNDGRIAVLDV